MDRIKVLRKEKGISQERLAMELNISQTMISKYELGQSEPDIQMIIKIAEYFNVSVDYLLEISEDKLNINSENLTDNEKSLLLDYKRLNEIQKVKAEAYIKGLLNG
ncbi:MAG: helix-turn-helix transcriptional regulator [Clostridia bacterium]|nr:helix-turn-helix transcriptional regulator [Clostridia bacterium]